MKILFLFSVKTKTIELSLLKEYNTRSYSLWNRFSKNKYLIGMILSIIILNYFFIFNTIFPLYESSCIYYNLKNPSDLKRNPPLNKDKINESNNKNQSYSSEREKKNIIYENKYYYNASEIYQIIEILFKNRGFNYLLLFNIFYILFLTSLIRLSLMDPGRINDEYKNIYSLKKYFNFYYKFCEKHNNIKEEEKKNIKNKKNWGLISNLHNFVEKKLIEIQNNNKTENKSNFESNDEIGKKLVASDNQNFKTCDKFDDEEILMSQTEVNSLTDEHNERNLIINRKIQDFDLKLEKYRNIPNLKIFWDLDCYNFEKKTIFENSCRYCILIKPERGYHCKMCKSCIRKLDHHCYIINNCVGYENYKLFLNMLTFAILSLMIVCMGMIDCLKLYLTENDVDLFKFIYLLIIFSIIMIGSVLLYYLIFHFTLIFRGISQYEYMFNIEIKEEKYFEKINNKSNFNKFMDVFGSNPIYWILPFKVNIKENNYGYKFQNPNLNKDEKLNIC